MHDPTDANERAIAFDVAVLGFAFYRRTPAGREHIDAGRVRFDRDTRTYTIDGEPVEVESRSK